MAKKVNALIFSWTAIDGCNIDPDHRNSIKEEITQLLHKYANKQQSLAGASTFVSSTHQQHNFQEQHQLQMPLEEQQEQKLQQLQHMPEEEQQLQQQKPQEMQQQHPQYRQEVQQQHPQNWQEQRWVWQNPRGRKENNKNRKRTERRQKQQEKKRHKRPRLSSYVKPGNHNQHGQPFSGFRRAPFTARTRPTPYFDPYDRSQPQRTNVSSLKRD